MGISLDTITQQISNFKNGFPFLKLIKPAIISDGIQVADEKKIEAAIEEYEKSRNKIKIVKFVPASGAASRMFKSIYEFIDNNKNKTVKIIDNGTIKVFFENIKNYAFYDDLKLVFTSHGKSLEDTIHNGGTVEVLEMLVNEKGLNYGNMPKGLLKFHRYQDECRTAFDEHLVEGVHYSSANGAVYLHLTVSAEHKERFESHVRKILDTYEKKYNIKFNISFSIQKKSTDTIAVDSKNEPAIDNGKVLFRPGGHGALLDNLNDIDADIIFIKNIDNVVPDHLKENTIKYKKALAGLLLIYQNRIFRYMSQLEKRNDGFDKAEYKEMIDFASDINIHIPENIVSAGPQQIGIYLKEKLNRPIRICGMVKNEGEPGGGPFWVENDENILSLQIVENSQINMSDKNQFDIYSKSTHFNPVDLVCGVKNYKGIKFNIMKFRDPDTGFISVKSKGGIELKAQELPGLWNGSMSDWITVFVEVPRVTFNPVKTVNDLLCIEHQNK